jgi:hypothetical protein
MSCEKPLADCVFSVPSVSSVVNALPWQGKKTFNTEDTEDTEKASAQRSF